MSDRICKVTEDQLFWMFRYCLSRRSYAVGDGVRAVLDNWDVLSSRTRDMIVKEINEAINDKAYPLSPIDANSWRAVLNRAASFVGDDDHLNSERQRRRQ